MQNTSVYTAKIKPFINAGSIVIRDNLLCYIIILYTIIIGQELEINSVGWGHWVFWRY